MLLNNSTSLQIMSLYFNRTVVYIPLKKTKINTENFFFIITRRLAFDEEITARFKTEFMRKTDFVARNKAAPFRKRFLPPGQLGLCMEKTFPSRHSGQSFFHVFAIIATRFG